MTEYVENKTSITKDNMSRFNMRLPLFLYYWTNQHKLPPVPLSTSSHLNKCPGGKELIVQK